MIRAAVVGLGRWGRRHVGAVQGGTAPASTEMRFTRAVVQTQAKSADFAREHALELGTDFGEVLADPTIDALILATPNSQHAAQVLACAAAGKSVLSEKPLALTLADAQQAVAACERAGVVLTVGQDKRYWPAMAALFRVVASGELGPLLHAEGHFSNENQKNYFTSWRELPTEAPASSLTATGIHVLDAMIHLFGPVARVSAQCLSQPPPMEALDSLALTFAFVRPVSAVLCGVRPTPLFFRLHVFARDGSAEVTGDRELIVRGTGGSMDRRQFEPVDALRLQLETFARAVVSTGKPAVSAEGEPPRGSADRSANWPIPPGEMLGTIAALEAVTASLRSGAPAAAAAP